MPLIFIIDDEKDICRCLSALLQDEGYRVASAGSLDKAWPKIMEETPSLILLDVWLEKGIWDGLSGLEKLHHAFPLVPIVMISGHASLSIAVKALQKGAHDFLEKPLDSCRVLNTVRHSLELSKLRLAKTQEPQEVWPVPLAPKLRKSALCDQWMVLVGEEGSGRLRLAKALHYMSPRASQGFKVISAQSLNTMDPAVWFGQESNGWVEKIGFLEPLSGGTLVLQNVHQLSPPWCAYWANMMEVKSHKRLHGESPVPLDIRLIATTTPEFLQSHDWMPALYHRLFQEPYTVPSLRHRPGDIPLWCTFFLHQIAQQWALESIHLDPSALQALQNYSWPGNIRQLYHVLALGVLMCIQDRNDNRRSFDVLALKALEPNKTDTPQVETSLCLKLTHLPQEVAGELKSLEGHHGESLDSLFSRPLKEARARFEWHYMKAQLGKIHGNMAQTAKNVGMNRAALHRKIKLLQQHIEKDEPKRA